MADSTVAEVYIAQVSASIPLAAESQLGIWDYAIRERDTRIIQALAKRLDLTAPLLTKIAEIDDLSVRVAYITRSDTNNEIILSKIINEHRASVLAGLLRSERACGDIELLKQLEPIALSAVSLTPTKALAEAIVLQSIFSLALRVKAIEVLTKFPSLAVSTIEAMRGVLEEAKAHEEYYVRTATAAGKVSGLRTEILCLNGVEDSTRIEYLKMEKEALNGPLRIPSILSVIELMLDNVDDLQPTVLETMAELSKSLSNVHPRRTSIIEVRISEYIQGDRSEQREKIADAVKMISQANEKGILDAINLTKEMCHSDVSFALLRNQYLPTEISCLIELMSMLSIAQLLTIVRERRDDIWTLAAYQTYTTAMIQADGWASCKDRVKCEITIARYLRNRWDKGSVVDVATLITFAQSCLSVEALLELPWTLFVEISGSYNMESHSDWISSAMIVAQRNLIEKGQWEMFEKLGLEFNGSLSELVTAARTL